MKATCIETICRWPNGVPALDIHILTLAKRCKIDQALFPAHGKQWLITYVGPNHCGEEGFAIEGIEMVEGLG